MKEIILACGAKTQVDDQDFDLNEFNWHLIGRGYVARRNRITDDVISKSRDILLAHIVVARMGLSIPLGYDVDHEDRDKLNHQRYNLRILTHSANLHNSGERSNNTSSVKGVHYDHRNGKWQVRIMVRTKRIHVGYFDSLEEAKIARANAEKRYL